MDTCNHVHKSLRYLTLLSSKERLLALNHPMWVDHPKAVELLHILENQMHIEYKTAHKNLFVIGEKGAGKTGVIERFVRQNPPFLFDKAGRNNCSVYPVRVVECINVSSEKELYIVLVEQIGKNWPETDNLNLWRHAANTCIKERSTKILLLDNIQNLFKGEPLKEKKLIELLKRLAQELMIVIVATLDFNVKEASITYRDINVFKLKKWSLDGDFLSLLASFELRLPLKKASYLTNKNKATLLFEKSGGNIGRLSSMLKALSAEAIISKEERITLHNIQNLRRFE